jgi:hypothetical protein
MIRIKSPQDLGAAIVFVAIGVAGLYFSSDLHMGSASRMGPGYFPQILSWCIIALGILIGARSFTVTGPPIERFHVRPITVIIIASLIFGYAIEEVGLALASVVALVIAPYARRGASFREALVLSIGLTAFAVIVFVWALGQPLPLWRGR